jgi:hypothetical protein
LQCGGIVTKQLSRLAPHRIHVSCVEMHPAWDRARGDAAAQRLLEVGPTCRIFLKDGSAFSERARTPA